MIIAKAPFRVSFAGGGSDLDVVYRHGYGAVVSTTINKYMHVLIHPYFHEKIRIKYSKLEDVDTVDQIEHPIVRACLQLLRIEKGIEIASIADVPAGTGIGSSSTFAVSLLHALYTYNRKCATKNVLAQQACKIEIDILKEPIGKQDQYAASFGGLNFIRFNADGSVLVEPIMCDPTVRRRLEERLLMFYVGNHRKAKSILSEQRRNSSKKDMYEKTCYLVKLAETFRSAIESGHLAHVGELLHEGWVLKRTLASAISNSRIDDYYEKAIKAGATGGKLLGAGGGGFLLFYCEPRYQKKVKEAMGLRELPFRFETGGSQIIYDDQEYGQAGQSRQR